jgi:hypothetical protein
MRKTVAHRLVEQKASVGHGKGRGANTESFSLFLCLRIGRLVTYDVKNTPFRGQTSWAKMTSPGGKPAALIYLPTRKVHKAD